MKWPIALVIMTVPVHAQLGATDNELYAAYCKGAMSALNQAGDVLQASQRFSAYLFATGPTRVAAMRCWVFLPLSLAGHRSSANAAWYFPR